MSNPIGPPSNDEIDITPSGTTIANNNSTDITGTSSLSANAFGSVEMLKLNYTKPDGNPDTIDVAGIRLPFSGGTLEVSKNANDSEQVSGQTYYKANWKFGTAAITTAAANTRNWPSALKTPSTSGNIEYQSSVGGSWTSMSVSNFRRMKLKTFTGGTIG